MARTAMSAMQAATSTAVASLSNANPTTSVSTEATTEPVKPAKRTRMSRYSWDAVEKTKTLMNLLVETLERKGNVERRYVSGSDWDQVFIDYNARLPHAPVANVFALKNRFALLKIQYKDYQKVVEATKAAPGKALDQAGWQDLIAKHPEVAKWRYATFDCYDLVQDYFRLAGLDDHADSNVDDDTPTKKENRASVKNILNGSAATIVTPSRSPSVTIRPSTGQSTVTVEALAAAVVQLEQQSQIRKRLAEEENQTHREDQAKKPRANSVTEESIESTEYQRALKVLESLNLSLTDRVDAKLFLAYAKHQQVFLHMDTEEQREFLDKYCFRARDEDGRWNAPKN